MRTRAGAAEVEAEQVLHATQELLAPFETTQGESPYQIHRELEETMQNYVGIFRNEEDLQKGLGELERLKRACRASES